MDILLSIVIPVYNVEKYLMDCVNSLLPQCDERCEIIMVDDGSTDSSGAICDELALNNKIIKVIHKPNEGAGSARNVGLDATKGEYVGFLDSDDMIIDGSLQIVLERLQSNKSDVCFLQAYKFYPDGSRVPIGDGIVSKKICGKSKKEVLKFLSSREKFSGSACTKVFRKDFLLLNNIRFPEERLLSEDLSFVIKALYSADSFDCLDVDYYLYRQNREGSITNKISEKTLDGLQYFMESSVEMFTNGKKVKDVNAKYCMSFVSYEYCIYLYTLSRLYGVEEKYMEYTKVNKDLLYFGRSKKTICIGLLSFMGVNFVINIMRKLKKD